MIIGLIIGSLINNHWLLIIIDVLFPLVGWLIEGFVYPFNNRKMMIDGIPNRPLYFYQKDIIVDNWIWWTIIYGLFMFVHKRQVLIQNMALFFQNSLHRLMFPWGLSVSLWIISMFFFFFFRDEFFHEHGEDVRLLWDLWQWLDEWLNFPFTSRSDSGEWVIVSSFVCTNIHVDM